jgi:uncharacterized tellurite resistance protein B-like protein
MSNPEAHFRALVRLALRDQNFAEVEKDLIFKLGRIHNMDEEAINKIIREEFSRNGDEHEIEFSALTFDQRFEYLYNMVQLMKADKKIFLSEIKFCEQMAVNLGFLKEAVQVLSSSIFADPQITVDRENLKRQLHKLDFS